MTYLDPLSALANAGSLLSANDEIVASYDLEVEGASVDGYRSLATVSAIRNANVEAFEIDYSRVSRLHVINGMGVTLGDSIIGISALAAIRRANPGISICIYRPRRDPEYVRQLYKLAEPVVGEIIDLPVHVGSMSRDDLLLDIGNHLFWPNFASMPMIDFFLWSLGVSPDAVTATDKANEWLRQVKLPAFNRDPLPEKYVLFCPVASTPVRSIPEPFRVELVERMWQKFNLPVLGFGKIDHAHYTDITNRSLDTAAFLSWVKGARFILTSDTAAVHIAAGFDVPTVAFFTTIAAELRVRDYPDCTAVDLPLPDLAGIQASGRAADLQLVERAYRWLLDGHWTL
ncbi:glycosyltransferase family 9 protein [Paraburkholderia sp. SIMBA_030]|uniref:glycosyltransferase family 9 protein n=2 Tax=Pseudomonadati TaxID=3379134 RepID=UPI00397BB043